MSEKEMIAEITEQTDRGAAIVAFSYLEDTLTKAIQSHLLNRKYKGEIIRNTLFRGAGPLATFSARRRLAYLLGFFGPKTYNDLERLAHIRNEFAHIHSRRSFKSQRIRGLCEALTTPVTKGYTSHPSELDARTLYTTTIMYICGVLGVVAKRDAHPTRESVLP